MKSIKKPLKTKWKILIVIVVVTLAFLYLIGFRIAINLTPPPCTSSNTITFQGQEIPIEGGCFATRTIPIYLSYSPKNCLNISTNTCNNPNIEILNKCEGEVVIQNRKYQKGYGYVHLDKGPFLVSGKVDKRIFFVLGFISPDWCKE